MFSLFRLRFFSFLAFAVLVVGMTVTTINAQYFGRNKVQYESFNFKIMKTEHFDIYFYPEEQKAVEQAARLAERWYARLSRILNHKLRGRQPLIIYSSQPHFQQTTAIPGVLGEGTGGVTEMFKRRVVLPFGASLAETDHVIGHELVHAFQFDITSQDHPRYAGRVPTALRLPLWFIEGLAEYLSIGSVDVHTAMWMRDALREKEFPTIKKLYDPRYFPYRYGHSLWSYITGRWGDGAVARIMKTVGKTGDYEDAFEKILKISIKSLSEDWQKAMNDVYNPLLDKTNVTDESSRALIKGTEENRLNVSPALSPDGKKIIFLSSKDLFSIDMFLADAETGKIKSKIVKTAVDPHFESLQFIRSSGSWDAEGHRFVFGAISRGRPVLSILNTENNEIEKEHVFPELGEILNPTWSPDGRYIAFSALAGGITDLFIYDLETDDVKRMMKDSFADLQPAWSPDGRNVAFVTDRFSTNLPLLSVGNYEIALIDPETGKIKRVEGFAQAKNVNPQWSPDSRSLLFISDQNGINNIYRVDLENKKITQLTNLYTGVTGITGLSPALSVAQRTGALAYCLYEKGMYNIYSIDSLENLSDKTPIAQLGQVMPSILPPRKRPEGELLGLLKNSLFGLPGESEFEITDYKSKLSLDYVSQPQVAVGVDRYGTYSGGGIALFWGDMLGYHSLATMLQLSTRIIDSSALVGYQNSRHRLNWGAALQRIPYVTGAFATGKAIVFGELAYIEEEYIFRQINYEVMGFASYPFNQVRRFDLSLGYRYIDFDREVRTRAISLSDNAVLINEKEKLPSPPGLHFGYASAAFVYDSSFFGATSPLLGQSYRVEFTQLTGSFSYSSVLADYRRYFMPVRPFTLAMRILHFGRYGKGAEDERLWPLFIGYESLVRGYDFGSFSPEECSPGADCFEFDRLLGTKMIVANFELRFPLFQVLGIGRGFYGIFPIEFNAFYDVGLAWYDKNEEDINWLGRTAWFLGGDRKPVSSAGIGLRMNFFGYMILGLNYVRPFNRTQKGWYFQFSFTPGF